MLIPPLRHGSTLRVLRSLDALGLRRVFIVKKCGAERGGRRRLDALPEPQRIIKRGQPPSWLPLPLLGGAIADVFHIGWVLHDHRLAAR